MTSPARPTRVARRPTLRSGSTRPTLRGIAFVLVGLACAPVAYILGRAELLYATGFLVLLPLAGYLVVRLRPLRLMATRSFSPPVVTAGTPTMVELSVRNLSAVSSPAASWTDPIPWSPHHAGPGSLPALPPGAIVKPTLSGRLGYSLRPALRGVYDIGPLDVRYTDPFGLAVGRLTVGASQSLYVVPLVVPLGQSVAVTVSGEGSARLVQRLATGADDDLMTREYRTGDALRRVHWRASARHGELMVRQEEQRSYPEARLILDTRADGYRPDASSVDFDGTGSTGSTGFEWAITMIASVGVHLHRSGFLVHILETAPRQVAPLGDAGQGSGQDLEFLLSLAGVTLRDPNPAFAEGDGERTRGTQGPVFAVVANPSAETLHWISSQRRPYETGVAFVMDTSNPAIPVALEAAGWLCIPVTDRADPAAAWSRVRSVTSHLVAEQR